MPSASDLHSACEFACGWYTMLSGRPAPVLALASSPLAVSSATPVPCLILASWSVPFFLVGVCVAPWQNALCLSIPWSVPVAVFVHAPVPKSVSGDS